MLNNNINDACRVCGYVPSEPPWGEDGRTPTYEICDCCGVEYGYEDCTSTAVANFRAAWIARGAQWFNKRAKPERWQLAEQLCRANIE
jgi:hypothetical protein